MAGERDSRGRFLTVPAGAAPPITSDNAREMVRKRTEKYRRAMVARIVREAASIDSTVQTPADAFGLVAAKQYTTLMDSEKPRMADLEKLRDMMTGRETGQDSHRSYAPIAPNSVTMPAETLVELVNMLEAQKQTAIDKARAVDGEVANSE